jgi:hypothetical protein
MSKYGKKTINLNYNIFYLHMHSIKLFTNEYLSHIVKLDIVTNVSTYEYCIV